MPCLRSVGRNVDLHPPVRDVCVGRKHLLLQEEEEDDDDDEDS